MACECNFVMLSVCVILFLGVASQTLSFALPGWIRFVPETDVKNGTTVLFEAGQTYSSGLWVECKGSLSDCDDWIDDSLNVAQNVGECAADRFRTIAGGSRQPVCRDYNNIELTMWVTQALGLFLMALALVFAILATVAYCCSGGCCGDCCIGFCKFFVLLVCMLASMAITVGLVLFGVTYAEENYRRLIYRSGFPIVVKELQLYYSFALSALAAILAMLAAIIAAFSKNDDQKA